MKRPNILQVDTRAGRRYSGAKVSAATLGLVAGIRLAAGLFEYELPISDEELVALGALLTSLVGYCLRRGME